MSPRNGNLQKIFIYNINNKTTVNITGIRLISYVVAHHATPSTQCTGLIMLPPKVILGNIVYCPQKQKYWRTGWVVHIETNVLPSTVRMPSNNPLHHILSICLPSFPQCTSTQSPQHQSHVSTPPDQSTTLSTWKMLQEVLHNTKAIENTTVNVRWKMYYGIYKFFK